MAGEYFGGPQKSGPSYTYDNQYKNDQGFKNRNSYGGVEGGADTAVNRYRDIAQAGATRDAYKADYGGYNNSMTDAGGARQQTQDTLGLIGQRARGQGPSAAEISGTSAMNTALANQVAAAGSGRGGPMQVAAAQRGAAERAAGQQAQMTAGIQAGRANEIANAQGQLLQGDLGMRGQDFQGAGMGLQKTAQDIQNEQYQRGLNQQSQEYYEGLANQVNQTQLAANQTATGQANDMSQNSIKNAEHSSDFGFGKVMQLGSMAAGAGTGGVGAALAAAKGGHVEHEHPYLVGEEGPELVVPKEDGWVMTAQQTAALRGAPPTDQQAENLPQRMLNGPMRRALGGPLPAGGQGMNDPGGSMQLTAGGGGLDVMGSLKKTNAIDTQYLHHPGFTREEGGPVGGSEKKGITATIAEKISDLRRAAADAISPEPAPIVAAPSHPPRTATTTPRTLEVYVAPARDRSQPEHRVPGGAPEGSGPVEKPFKKVVDPATGAYVMGRDPLPARAGGGSMSGGGETATYGGMAGMQSQSPKLQQSAQPMAPQRPPPMYATARAVGGVMDADPSGARAQAGRDVAATRKAGGYAALDMTPIPEGHGGQYFGRDEQAQTAKLHGAIERETEGVDPYHVEPAAPQSPQDRETDNMVEADKIRDRFAQGGEQYDPAFGSIGDRAKAKAMPPGAPGGGGWLGRFLTGFSQGMHPPARERA